MKSVFSFGLVFTPIAQYYFYKRFRQPDIVEVECLVEQRGYLLIGKTGYAASYPCYIESVLIPLPGKVNELVYVRFYSLNPALHGRDGIGLSLYTDTLSHYGSEVAQRGQRSPATMLAGKVAVLPNTNMSSRPRCVICSGVYFSPSIR